jgi:TAG lipase/lysophosphatidylethanolamine acyltransferase
MQSFTVRTVLTPAIYGVKRLYAWWTRKSTTDILIESIDEARLFEEWEAAAYQLDEVLGFDLWFVLICGC